MFVEDGIFEISHVVWRYRESREITGDRNPHESRFALESILCRSGVKSVASIGQRLEAGAI